MLRKILTFFQKETVLSISAILAILSMFIVHPSGKYLSYIDFRTLSLLFCLMSIVAGLKLDYLIILPKKYCPEPTASNLSSYCLFCYVFSFQ